MGKYMFGILRQNHRFFFFLKKKHSNCSLHEQGKRVIKTPECNPGKLDMLQLLFKWLTFRTVLAYLGIRAKEFSRIYFWVNVLLRHSCKTY